MDHLQHFVFVFAVPCTNKIKMFFAVTEVVILFPDGHTEKSAKNVKF